MNINYNISRADNLIISESQNCSKAKLKVSVTDGVAPYICSIDGIELFTLNEGEEGEALIDRGVELDLIVKDSEKEQTIKILARASYSAEDFNIYHKEVSEGNFTIYIDSIDDTMADTFFEDLTYDTYTIGMEDPLGCAFDIVYTIPKPYSIGYRVDLDPANNGEGNYCTRAACYVTNIRDAVYPISQKQLDVDEEKWTYRKVEGGSSWNLFNTSGDTESSLLVVRGKKYRWIFKDSTGVESLIELEVIKPYTIDDYEITHEPSGDKFNIIIKYLDGTMSDKYIKNVDSGTHDIILDAHYGCTIDTKYFIPFVPEELTLSYSDHLYISPINSIRFKENIDWDNCRTNRNWTNEFSCEMQYFKPVHTQKILYNSCDKVPLQVQSGKDFEVNILSLEGEVLDSLEKTKVSDLQNEKVDIEARLTNYFSDEGYDIIIFDTNTKPDWLEVGKSLLVKEKLVEVKKVEFGNGYNYQDTYYALIDKGLATTSYLSFEKITIQTIVNHADYDFYNIEIDMYSYQDKEIRVQVKNDVKEYLSEIISVKKNHENTIYVQYRNESNGNEIFYSSGIEFIARLELDDIKANLDQEEENHKSDSYVYGIESRQYHTERFVLTPLTMPYMRVVSKIFAHKKLYVNGIGYIINGKPEVEKQNYSNLYTFQLDLIETNVPYVSYIGENPNEVIQSYEVPTIINVDGFLRY